MTFVTLCRQCSLFSQLQKFELALGAQVSSQFVYDQTTTKEAKQQPLKLIQTDYGASGPQELCLERSGLKCNEGDWV